MSVLQVGDVDTAQLMRKQVVTATASGQIDRFDENRWLGFEKLSYIALVAINYNIKQNTLLSRAWCLEIASGRAGGSTSTIAFRHCYMLPDWVVVDQRVTCTNVIPRLTFPRRRCRNLRSLLRLRRARRMAFFLVSPAVRANARICL